jgi:hypothetical protein
MVNVEKLREILMSHPVKNLRKAISDSNKKLGVIKGYWSKGTGKLGIIEAMLETPNRFKDIKMYVPPPRKPRAKKSAPAPAPAPAKKKRVVKVKKSAIVSAPAPAKKPRKPRTKKN